MEFSSNISLRKGDEERYQLLYATQLYGTLFGVFGKFSWEEVDAGLKINKISLRGINYKGPYTLKIDPQFDRPALVQSKSVNFSVLALTLYLQADSPGVQDLPEVVWDFEKSFPSEKVILRDSDYFRINRRLKPMVTTGGSVKERAFKNGMFDEEFFYRDGLYVREKTDHVEVTSFTKGNLIQEEARDNPGFNDLELDDMLGSIRCTPGMSKVNC